MIALAVVVSLLSLSPPGGGKRVQFVTVAIDERIEDTFDDTAFDLISQLGAAAIQGSDPVAAFAGSCVPNDTAEPGTQCPAAETMDCECCVEIRRNSNEETGRFRVRGNLNIGGKFGSVNQVTEDATATVYIAEYVHGEATVTANGVEITDYFEVAGARIEGEPVVFLGA